MALREALSRGGVGGAHPAPGSLRLPLTPASLPSLGR